MSLKTKVGSLPVVGPLARSIWSALKGGPSFTTSGEFWEQNYATGGDSGAGSYGELANYKADILNAFVAANDIDSVIEFGCGDGNQLSLARYRRYTGYDVSRMAVEMCRKRFAGDDSKTFFKVDAYDGRQADLVLSLDVIYHLVEDDVFEAYMRSLLRAGRRHLIIYSSNWPDPFDHGTKHIRHRKFTDWMDANAPQWKLVEHQRNKFAAPFRAEGYRDRVVSNADFYFFRNSE